MFACRAINKDDHVRLQSKCRSSRCVEFAFFLCRLFQLQFQQNRNSLKRHIDTQKLRNNRDEKKIMMTLFDINKMKKSKTPFNSTAHSEWMLKNTTMHTGMKSSHSLNCTRIEQKHKVKKWNRRKTPSILLRFYGTVELFYCVIQ